MDRRSLVILTLFFTSCATKVELSRDHGKSTFKAISKKFDSLDSAYEEIHGDCKRAWKKKFGSLTSSNATYSVEIISIDPKSSFLSALCVATTYEVSRLIKRRPASKY